VTRSRLALALALAVLAATASRALAQDAEARAFVVRVVDAINSKSIESRRALLHPKSLPCATTAADSFYVWMVTRQFKDTIPADYTWKLTAVPSISRSAFPYASSLVLLGAGLLLTTVSLSWNGRSGWCVGMSSNPEPTVAGVH